MTCDPNVYGPYSHTLFLGASVQRFAGSVGWNEQSSQLSVTVVNDPCPAASGYKVYYDSSLNQQLTAGPDPGFEEPQAGTIAYFRMGNFDFAGIVQSWSESNDAEGNNIYEVNLTDPRELLDGCELILSGYAGGIGIVPNIFNCYQFVQVFGGSCNSLSLDAGMDWDVIRTCLSCMISANVAITMTGNPYGRILFRGQEFYLDITEIPRAYGYRVSGANITIGDLIRQVCNDLGLDYYCDLLIVPQGSGTVNIIKIRTVSRAAQPDLTQIDNFIGNSVGAIATRKGRELRNETVSRVIVGGPIQSMYTQVFAGDGSDATIWPFWGYDAEGNVIVGQGYNDAHNFTIDTSQLNIGIDTYNISVIELRSALAGQDVWLSFIANHKPDEAEAIGLTAGNAPLTFASIIDRLHNNQPCHPQDIINAKQAALQLSKEFLDRELNIRRVDLLWDLVNTYANEYYGRKFMVYAPVICVKRDSSGILLYSHDVSDAGWSDTTVLGVQDAANLDVFRTDDGRIKCFARFDNVLQNANFLNLGDLNPDTCFIEDGTLFIEAQADPTIVFVNKANIVSPRVVITLVDTVSVRPTDPNAEPHYYAFVIHETERLTNTFAQNEQQRIVNKMRELLNQLGSSMIQFAEEFPRQLPFYVAIPLKSNEDVYGPWGISALVDGLIPEGKVNYEQNEDLVPWNYGSVTALDIAGNFLASEGVTGMMEGETGQIQVPGLPTLRLGDELMSGGSSLGALRQTALGTDSVNGGTEIQFLTVETSSWTGISGPNITGIDCTIDNGGITTTYRMRTFTPSFGILGRQNAERIRRSGQLASKLRRQFRRLNRRPQPFALGLRRRGSHILEERGRAMFNIKSPHTMLLGQKVYGGDVIRPAVQSQNLAESMSEINNWVDKHIMSMDGLLRPFELYLDFVNFDPETMGRYSKPALPPVDGDNFEEMPITSYTLNPFLNPQDQTPEYPLGLNETGHDIEYISHGEDYPRNLNIQQNSDYPDTHDYRGLSLRGPLILTSWGYDINGKPVPNETDDFEADEADGYSDKFKPGWLKDQDSWKTGPVDLRWDDDRGVWTSWPGFKLVRAEFLEDINTDEEGNARILDEVDKFDQDGLAATSRVDEETQTNIITVKNTTEGLLIEGSRGICYYDTTSKTYWVLQSVAGGLSVARAQSNITPGVNSNGGATLLEWDEEDEEYQPTGSTITLFDPFGKCCVLTGEECHVQRAHGRYEIVGETGLTRRGKLASTLSPGDSCSVDIWVDGSNTGVTVIAYDWLMKAGASSATSGLTCEISWDVGAQKWYFSEIQCS